MNYYEEFNIDPSLSTEEIRKILLKENRRWANRVNAADLERRQFAEKKVDILVEAEKAFKDDEARIEYDKKLAGSANQGQGRPRPDVEPNSNNYQEYIDRAMELYRMNKGGEALNLANQATQMAPNIAETWNVLGIIQSDLGNGNSAIQSYLKALSIEPNNLVINANLGFLYLELNMVGDARLVAEKLSKLDGDYIRGISLMAATLERESRYNDAIELLESALERHPGDADLNHNMALVYSKKAYSYCHYNTRDDKYYIVEGDTIPYIVDCFSKANEYNPNETYANSISWAEGHLNTEFDSRNRVFFLIPIIIFYAYKNLVGIVVAFLIGYILFKASQISNWEKNREIFFNENIRWKKVLRVSKNLFNKTGEKMKEAKEVVDSKVREERSKKSN